MPRVLKNLPTREEVTALCWAEFGLVAGDISGSLTIWPTDDTAKGGVCHLAASIDPLRVHSLAVCSLCAIGVSVISCGLDNAVFVSAPDAPPRRIAAEIADPSTALALESERRLCVGTLSGIVHVFEIDTFQPVYTIEIFKSPIVRLSSHPTSGGFFGLSETELVLIGLEGAIEKRVPIEVDCCTSCAVTPDGYSVAVGTTEGTVRIVDAVAFREVGAIVFDETELNEVGHYDYGKHFVVAAMDGKVGVFDIRKMVKEPGVKVGGKPLVALAVRQAIGKAAVAGCESAVTLLDFG
jgi:WD40 repeat protein